MATQPFNPYYVQPKDTYSAYQGQSQGGGMGAVGPISQGASMLIGDINDINSSKAPSIDYQNDQAYKPSFDYTGNRDQLNEMNEYNKKYGGRLAGSTAKYAASGAAIGSVVPVIGTAIGAAVGAAAGLTVGLAKERKNKKNAEQFGNNLNQTTSTYNRDLSNYNINQATNEVNGLQKEKYAATNPYSIPQSAYWY